MRSEGVERSCGLSAGEPPPLLQGVNDSDEPEHGEEDEANQETPTTDGSR